MANASVALATARTLLNDDAETLWTDAVLLPKLQEAHRELQVKLEEAGIPVIHTVTAVLTVTAGQTFMPSITGYPTDLIEPIAMKERQVGETNEDFIDMTERDFLPLIAQTNRLGYWTWMDQAIWFVGALVDVEVLLQYTKSITVPTSAGSAIGVIFGENYLGHRTAALAASSVGNETGYTEWNAEALGKLDSVVSMNIKGSQNLPARQKGYHRNRFGGRRFLPLGI